MKQLLITLFLIANSLALTPTFAQNTQPTAPPADARTAAQKAQADANTRRDAKLADQMEKDRLKAEAQARPYTPPAQAGAPQEAASAPASQKSAKKKKKEPEHFTAQVPGSGKEEAKAKKAAKKAEKKAAKPSKKKDA